MAQDRQRQMLLSLILVAVFVGVGCAGQRRVAVKPQPVEKAASRERVYFDFDRAAIRNQDRPILDRVASKIESDKKSMAIVEGHADQIGSTRYNEVLAEKRARAVRVYLRDRGADPRRVTMTSKGSREPLVRGRGRAGLQENRRVEIFMGLDGRKDE